MNEELIEKAILTAKQYEEKYEKRIPAIYFVGEEYFFDFEQTKDKKVDFTIVRADMDPRMQNEFNQSLNKKKDVYRGGF